MAKGSVRKKGKKWYYRFYVEDASGNRVQKEFPGTESKSETESLLRKAMEDYETKMFLAQAKNITLGGKAVCGESGKHHRGRYAGYVGGGRTETRFIE